MEATFKSRDALRVHEDHAGGDAQVLYCDDDLYIMQRLGWGAQKFGFRAQ